MTFYTFMMQNYYGKDTPEGDFAADMERDNGFPKKVTSKSNNEYLMILDHLMAMGACDDALEAFKLCWEEYKHKKCENK